MNRTLIAAVVVLVAVGALAYTRNTQTNAGQPHVPLKGATSQ